jgi:hypothetical protein
MIGLVVFAVVFVIFQDTGAALMAGVVAWLVLDLPSRKQ